MTSYLSVYNLDSGRIEIVLETERLIEAPNWSPDGRFLIVNGDGRLFRVDLESPALDPIDTGFARKLNNDHGISPDGMTLAISDATQYGASCIYTLPIAGGTPTLVTKNVPSWWHGWSPDGETLVYAARRDGPVGIHRIAVTGGPETCLTTGFDHCDGPEFTPDSTWIWFNGEESGSMDLWRMHPDGSALEQMTDDASQAWFPHPSPDRLSVLYLAYAPGVSGHPRDHDVALRLIPASGGSSRHLCAIFGGQGSLNVPCWHPDSTRFAFVAYRDFRKV